MTSVFDHSAAIPIIAFGIGAVIFLGISIFWLFNKRAKSRHLAYLRARLAELEPSDPEYNLVRRLYISMAIDAERSGYFRSDAGSSDQGASVSHGSGDYVADFGGGGDHH
jgi:hypothetical protein